MNKSLLSQEEIDALLKQEPNETETNELEITENSNNDNSIYLTEVEKDALGEIGNIAMGTSATTLSMLLNNKVRITTPNVQLINADDLQRDYSLPYVTVEVLYKDGLTGSNILIIKKHDAILIADLMMGGTGDVSESDLDEIHLSAVGEAMNQMMGSATTSLSAMFNRRIDINPPSINIVDFRIEPMDQKFGSQYGKIAKIAFRMEIENLLDSEIMQVVPLGDARYMVKSLMGETSDDMPVKMDSELMADSPEPQSSDDSTITQTTNQPVRQTAEIIDGQFDSPVQRRESGQQYNVQSVAFPTLDESKTLITPQNMGLIMDVPLEVSVELGKTRRSIKDIIEMGPGSILQLDKLAGEFVDLKVNGKLLAKGEVVVIDENYGIRITQIISPSDRIEKIQ